MEKDIIYYTRDCYIYCKKNDNGEIVIKSIEDAHRDTSSIERQLREKINKIKNYIANEKRRIPMGKDEISCEIKYSSEVVPIDGLLKIIEDKGE